MRPHHSTFYRYDVFVNYHDTDREWVDEWLLPKLNHVGLKFVTQDNYPIGMPKIEIIESAIKESFYTITVLSPAWMASEWNRLVGIVVRSTDPDASQRKLLPIKLKEVNLPDYLNILQQVDMTAQTRWDKGVNQLVKNISHTLPVAPPWKEGGIADLLQWAKWVKRYKWNLFLNFLLVSFLGLIIAAIIKIPPFQDRIGWKKLNNGVLPSVASLLNTPNYLLASTYTDLSGCDTSVDSGLFKASWTDGVLEEWKKITVPEFFYKKNGECILSNINSFHLLSNGVILAGTSLTRIIASYDNGETWESFNSKNLHPNIKSIRSTKDNDLFVISQRENLKGHLYKYQANTHWEKISSYRLCENNETITIDHDVNISNLEVIENDVYISIDEKNKDDAYPSTISGLYKYDVVHECINQLLSYQERYFLYKIFYNKNKNTLHLLLLDNKATPEENSRYLWIYYINTGKKTSEWAGKYTIFDIHGDNNYWYLSDTSGNVYQGKYGGTHNDIEKYPNNKCRLSNLINKEIINYRCLTKLEAGNEENSLIYSTFNEVYKLSTVNWYTAIWP